MLRTLLSIMDVVVMSMIGGKGEGGGFRPVAAVDRRGAEDALTLCDLRLE